MDAGKMQLRKRAASRSRARGYKSKRPGIIAVDACDHVWDARGVCMRCDSQVAVIRMREGA